MSEFFYVSKKQFPSISTMILAGCSIAVVNFGFRKLALQGNIYCKLYCKRRKICKQPVPTNYIIAICPMKYGTCSAINVKKPETLLGTEVAHIS